MEQLGLVIDLSDRSDPKVTKFNNNLSEMQNHLDKSKNKFATFEEKLGKLKNAFHSVTNVVFSLKGALTALGTVLAARSFITVADSFNRLKDTLDVITKGQGVQWFERLNEWALRMPINTERAIQSFTMMRAMGLQPTIQQMTTLVDVTAALGGTPDVMDSISRALGRIATKGKASARDLLMLTERGVPAIEILREQLHDTSIGFDNISQSVYTSDQIITALFVGMEEGFGGLSSKIQNRWAGLTETMRSYWTEFKRLVMEAGVMEHIESGLQRVVSWIDKLKDEGKLQEWAEDVGNKVIGIFISLEDKIEDVIVNVDKLTIAFNALTLAVKAFISYKVAAILTDIGIALKGLFIGGAALGAATKGGLIGLALFGGYEIGTWLNKFTVIEKFGISLAAGLEKTYIKIKYAIINLIDDAMLRVTEKINAIKDLFKDAAKFFSDPLGYLKAFAAATANPYEFYYAPIVRPPNEQAIIDRMEQHNRDQKTAIEEIDRLYSEMFMNVGNHLDTTKEKTEKIKQPVKEIADMVKTILSTPSESYSTVYNDLLNGWKWVNQEFQQTDEIISTLTPDITAMGQEAIQWFNDMNRELRAQIDLYNEIQRKIDEWRRVGQYAAYFFTDAFSDYVMGNKNAFDDLGRFIGKSIISTATQQMITEPFIQPLITSIIFGMQGKLMPASFVGPLAPGQQYAPTWMGSWGRSQIMGSLGAGAFGYGLGGIGGGVGAAGGYLAGSSLFEGAAGGPIGMIGGLVLGKIAESIFHSDPPEPQIDLIYKVIDSQINLISESFKHTPKNQELLDSVQKSLQTQIDFYNRISQLTSGTLADFTINLSGRTAFDIQRNVQMNNFQLMATQYANLSKMIPGFDQKFQELFQQIFPMDYYPSVIKILETRPGWRDVTSKDVDKYVQNISGMLPPEVLDKIKTAQNPGKVLEDWLNSTIVASGRYTASQGKYAGQIFDFSQAASPLDLLVGDLSKVDDYFNQISERFFQIQTNIAQMVGNAFFDSLDTTGFQGFGDTLEKFMYDKVKSGLAQGFTNQVLDIIMKSDTGFVKAFGLLEQFSKGEGGITLSDVTGAFQSSFGQMGSLLEEIRPVYDIFSEEMKKLGQALGLNTTAVGANTNAILGPVNSFLMSLDTGPLAPVQSMAKLAGLQSELYTAAFANPEQFNPYASFMTGTYLPWMQATSPDYAGTVAGVRAGVEAMPWVAEARGVTPTAADIGTSVATAVAPMLLDLKESMGPITIQIIVDGQVIKQQVIESLDDPAVVTKARSRS